MRTTLLIVLLGVMNNYSEAIDLTSLAKDKLQLEAKTLSEDGPTNGEMSEDEKDTLIQVLCPGNVITSYSLTQGKSSTCNSGLPGAKKSASLV